MILRQEALTLAASGGGFDAAFVVTIQTEVYRGAGARYVVRLGSLRLHVAASKPLAAGDARMVCWNRVDARVI